MPKFIPEYLGTSTPDITLSGDDGADLNVGSGGTLGTAAFTPSTQYEPAIVASNTGTKFWRDDKTFQSIPGIPIVSDVAYDATTWNSNTDAPTKNVVRDKFETLGTLSTQNGTFSGTSSGVNTGDQTITLTGNVTGTGTGSFATTIAAGAVTNAMLAGSIDLATKVTGTLPVANGGTGDTGTAWASTTPTPTPGSGAFTTVAGNVRALKIGKTVFFNAAITITTNGTAGVSIDIALPYSSASLGRRQSAAGSEEAVIGISARCAILDNSTTLRVTKYDGTYLGGDGYVIAINGVYEST